MYYIFEVLDAIQEFIWGYIGIFMILTLGVYFTLKSRVMQLRAFPGVIRYCKESLSYRCEPGEVHPLKAFFGALGGCVGIGNLITISLAIKIGGPGAILWMWVIAFFGVTLKYAEVFLGIKYRVRRGGKYMGGPMYFLRKAFPNVKWIASIMALLMCLYGVEIFMFKVVQDSFVRNFDLDANTVTLVLLGVILYGVSGGLNKLGTINSILIPAFILCFFGATLFVLWENSARLGGAFQTIFASAFTGYAAVGGFLGSTVLTTVSRGISSACYSGDIAIGYESIMHSEASIKDIKKQASLTFLSIFLDTFVVCTCTALIVVVTGVWNQGFKETMMLQRAFEPYFPFISTLMPFILFTLAYSTIISYFYAGLSCASFLSPRFGKRIFYVFGSACFIAFSFVETAQAAIIMYTAGGGLMIVNTMGIFKLRKEITF